LEATERRNALGIAVEGVEQGLYVQFDSPENVDLRLQSLENRQIGIELVAVQIVQPDPERAPIQRAPCLSGGALQHFVSRFEEYGTERNKKSGEPKHREMVDRIAALRLATLRALWTEDAEYPDEAEVIWWEVWLRRHDGRELDRLSEFAQAVGLVIGARQLAFDDRIVVLVHGAAAQLSGSLAVLNDVAEVRLAKESAALIRTRPPRSRRRG